MKFKQFKEYMSEEKEKTTVFSFGRMNPPTTGHQKLVDKVHSLAKEHHADHLVVLSHSHDAAKNPLSPDQKLKHAKRFFPKTNLGMADKEHPSFLHQVSKLHKEGTKHLVMVAGSDRVPEYEKTLHRYNGTGEKHLYNFKSIKVVSAGHRDPDAEGSEGMSASKMRKHVSDNNYSEFKKGIPSHVAEKHSKELFNDVKAGLTAKPKSVREQYMNNEIFNIGEIIYVENVEAVILGRANNFLTIEKANGVVEKRWLQDIKEDYDPFYNTVEDEIPIVEERKSLLKYSKKELPRLLMTPKQIEEAAKVHEQKNQITFMGYTTKNFDTEPKAKTLFANLIATMKQYDAGGETENEKKATAAHVGSLVKPMHVRHQQIKHYLNN
jgi:hypothetical protein